MIIPDANVLIHAHDQRSGHHAKALEWWTAALGSPEPIGIPWVVLMAFTRLMTHPQVCENPLSIAQAREIVLGWLDFSHVRLLQVSEQAPARFFDILDQAGSGGNLTTDALIALHAMEHSGFVYSKDRDCDRVPGIRRINPLA